MLLRQVVGESMLPSLRPGMVVAAFSNKLRIGDIVIAEQAGLEVVKRVSKISKEGIYLKGDNKEQSTDSATYGLVRHDDVKGKVILRLPSKTPFIIRNKYR